MNIMVDKNNIIIEFWFTRENVGPALTENTLQN